MKTLRSILSCLRVGILLVFAFSEVQLMQLSKCCPPDEGIKLIENSNNFQCVPENFSYVYPLEMHNISVKSLDFCVGNDKHSCVDKVIMENNAPPSEQRIVSVNCSNEVENIKVGVSTLRKCCPKSNVYAPEEHRCVRIENNVNFLDYFENRNNTLTNVKVGLMECTGVIVDYLINSTLFTLQESEIKELIETIHGKDNNYCVDSTTSDGNWVLRGCKDEITEVCKKITCVRKCCPDGHHTKNKICVPSFDKTFSPKFHRKGENDTWDDHKVVEFAQLQGHTCKYKKYLLNAKRYTFYLSELGNLHYKKETLQATEHTYCYEYVEGGGLKGNYFFNCISAGPKDTFSVKYFINRYGLVLSIIFLFATIIVYLFMPRNLHAKTVICHCSSLFTAYFCLGFAQWKSGITETSCVVFGYAIMYTFLVAFSWLNVMCFDIWWTFGSFRGLAFGDGRRAEEKTKFMWYSIYGWLLPMLITGSAMVADFSDFAPDVLKPHMGENACFFRKPFGVPYWIYFVVPIALQRTGDIIFFVLTVWYCFSVKLEMHHMQESNKNFFKTGKTILILNMKLFTVMGISWILEVLSAIIGGPEKYWYAADAYNALQGIPIFCIYVLKGNVLQTVKEKFGFKSPRRPSQTVSTALSTTTSLAVKKGANSIVPKTNNRIV